ncbi:MAG: VIT domain-containing protein [Variovorax sp.]
MSPSPSAGRRLWAATVMLAVISFATLVAKPLCAQTQPRPDAAASKTESPYFFVSNADADLDTLPLKSTQVDVHIAGVIADVVVTQRYRNEGRRAIEARYVFPGSTRAAVNGLNVRLADRLITAQIREKRQARIEYDAAKRQGKTAALLEQHRPNVFQMNVANILPGDDVRVELHYTELLVPQSGQYQFAFPTVVGPRCNSPESRSAQATWAAQPTLAPGVAASASFDLKVTLDTPIGLKEVRSKTHAIDVQMAANDARHAAVSLKADRGPADNRDFVLDYRLAGEAIESGLLLYQAPAGDDGNKGGSGTENFFLAMIEPPRAVTAEAISPRDYIFVVDVSGSMHGFPLDTAKTVMRRLLGGLRPSDSFNVLLFSGGSDMLAPHSLPATQANVARAIATIDRYNGSGATELIPALRRVYAEPKPPQLSRSIVVVTDGYVTVEREAFELVQKNLGQANLFAFGIGSSVNRHLIEGLARAGMGEPFVITDPIQAPEQAARFRRMIEAPVLTSVRAIFEGLDVYDVEPPVLPDVLGERPVIVFGKWRASGTGKAGARVTIDGRSASGPYRSSVAAGADAGGQNVALRSLWARHRIQSLTDQQGIDGNDDTTRPAITALGLEYGLLTRYTSFIAIDQVVRNSAPQASASVRQPVPLPQGVSALAIGRGGSGGGAGSGDGVVNGAGGVGTEVPGTPEPETLAAVAAVLTTFSLWALRRRRVRTRAAWQHGTGNDTRTRTGGRS